MAKENEQDKLLKRINELAKKIRLKVSLLPKRRNVKSFASSTWPTSGQLSAVTSNIRSFTTKKGKRLLPKNYGRHSGKVV